MKRVHDFDNVIKYFLTRGYILQFQLTSIYMPGFIIGSYRTVHENTPKRILTIPKKDNTT